MNKSEIAELIGEAKDYLARNWYQMKPHARDELKSKIRLLKKKLRKEVA